MTEEKEWARQAFNRHRRATGAPWCDAIERQQQGLPLAREANSRPTSIVTIMLWTAFFAIGGTAAIIILLDSGILHR